MPFRHFYLLSHYICNGLFVLFSVCWLHVNEFNSLCGDKGGRGQKSTSCSEVVSVGDFYCSVPTLQLLWSIIFINHYIVAIYHSSQERYIRIYDKCKGNFFNIGENDNFLSLYCSLKRVPNLLDDTSSE